MSGIFTISNIGMASKILAIINPPGAAMLAVAKMVDKQVFINSRLLRTRDPFYDQHRSPG
jgi:pyruvate/2-oxoglutarate dehydrogenase complex dihydrolipoamide acyltransferase (E2) component